MRVDSQDPFNYPSLNRKDLMSLSTLNTKQDVKNISTKKFVSYRDSSLNLQIHDIDKAYPKKIGGP